MSLLNQNVAQNTRYLERRWTPGSMVLLDPQKMEEAIRKAWFLEGEAPTPDLSGALGHRIEGMWGDSQAYTSATTMAAWTAVQQAEDQETQLAVLTGPSLFLGFSMPLKSCLDIFWSVCTDRTVPTQMAITHHVVPTRFACSQPHRGIPRPSCLPWLIQPKWSMLL